MYVSTVRELKPEKAPETSLSIAHWKMLSVEDAFDQETLAAALEMCRRILPARKVGTPFSIEVLIDDPLHQQTQIQTVQTILNDQIARQRLQSPLKAEIDVEVTRIVKRVCGEQT